MGLIRMLAMLGVIRRATVALIYAGDMARKMHTALLHVVV